MGFDYVRISGPQLCNYIWALKRPATSDENSLASNHLQEPVWTPDTELLVTFNHSLLAGNITSGESAVNSWKIYRRAGDEGKWELAAVVDGSTTSIIDYAVKNHTTYRYSFAAESESYITAPIESDPISTSWNNWCLFSADSTDNADNLVFHEGFIFEANVSGDAMNNNLSIGTFPNFTRYSKIHKARTNHYSSSLGALLGYLNCDTAKIEDTLDIEGRLKEFSTDPRRKFLRDYKGHLWEVEISSPFSVQPYHGTHHLPYEGQIGWTEIGNADGVQITNFSGEA